MDNKIRNFILVIAIIQLILTGGLLALPKAVQAIPGRYRVALAERNPFLSNIAEGVIARVAPVATALPAPVQPVGEAVDLGELVAGPTTAVSLPASSTATPVPQPTDLPSAEPATTEPAATKTAVPTATTTPTPQPTATPTPIPLPSQVRLSGLQPVRQSFNNCGPANLTQVLNFYGADISQAQAASYLKPNPEDRNVSPWQIADYVNEQTPYQARVFVGGTLEMLKRLIAAGFPVVVEKGYEPNVEGAPGWWGHYLTLFGYDDEAQVFNSMDSYLGPFNTNEGRTDSYESIAFYWQHFNYTFYVVFEPAQEQLILDLLGPEMADPFTMWQNAANRANEETKAEPDNPFAWFNLGTSLTAMGELTGEERYYQGGAQAFDKAREIGLPPRMLWYQFRPYLAYLKTGRYQDVLALADATLETQGGRNVEETYWYKGHALAFLGDIAGARAAYEAALRVNENFYPAQISLDSLP